MPENTTAAVQVDQGDKIYYFLDNGQYISTDADGQNESPGVIKEDWLPSVGETINISQINSTFVYSGKTYLIEGTTVYQLEGPITENYVLWQEQPSELQNSDLSFIDETWNTIHAAFTVNRTNITFFFNNELGRVLEKGDGNTTSIRDRFGLLHGEQSPQIDTIKTAIVWDNGTEYLLHLIDGDGNYSYWNKDGSISASVSTG